jgi:hypothetical protein
LRQVGEDVGYFPFSDVLVIAFAALVVEPQDAHFVNHKDQAVLEGVRAARNGLWQLPDYHFGKPAFAYDPSFTKQQPWLHVGIYTNAEGTVNAAPGEVASGDSVGFCRSYRPPSAAVLTYSRPMGLCKTGKNALFSMLAQWHIEDLRRIEDLPPRVAAGRGTGET